MWAGKEVSGLAQVSGIPDFKVIHSHKRMPQTPEPTVRLEATQKTPTTVIKEMTDWQTSIPDFTLYGELGFTLTSVKLEVSKNKAGEVVKGYKPVGKWKEEATRVLKADTQYAILTGVKSGISVIDIDNPEADHNKELIDLMTECNMVAKTNHGYHYLYKYTDKLKTTTSKPLELDIRNDDAIIFCSPSRLEHEGKVLASYEWIKEPMGEGLSEIPDEVLEYLLKLDSRFVAGIVAPVEEEEEAEEDVSETHTISTVDEVVGDHELLPVINALTKRYENYDDWLKIGLVCHNEKVGLEIWDTATRTHYKRYANGLSKRDCKAKWATFGKERRDKMLTSATLWHMLKKDDPTKFYELMENRKDFLNMLMLLNSNDIAKYFYNINPDKYIYNEHLGWYSITGNNTWSHSEKAIPSGIKGDISNTFQQLCLDTKKSVLAKYAKLRSGCKDPEKDKELKTECEEKISLIHKSYKTLGGADFCSGVVSFLDTYYNDPELETKMDTNPYLYAFSDGLYDLNKGGFRRISPSDMISITTGYKIPSGNKKVRAEIEKFLLGLFEDQSITDYLMEVLASSLLGFNKFEKFYVFTGAGGNGKGVITELLQKAFGNYYYPVNVSLFTKIQERLDQPVPALVEARNKRMMMSSEPETNEKLQVSMLKKISGGDPMEARTLHSKHIFKFKPMYKPFFQANDIPKLSKVDNGVQRRMEVIKFPFNFVAKPTLPHERQGDPDVKNIKCQSDEWRDEFILMLTEIYTTKLHTAKCIELPEAVKASTGEYIDDNNPLKGWLNTYYTITKNDADKITARDLKKAYMDDNKVEKCDDRWFKQMLTFNSITHGRTGTGAVYMGLIRKPILLTNEVVEGDDE